jgi:hypothetical protein
MKFHKHSEGGVTLFMVAGKDAAKALTRMEGMKVPASVNHYAKTTVIIVNDKNAPAIEEELQRR